MDGPTTSLEVSTNNALTHEEICENATILDEGIRLCPLCASEVRLFFINFNEKILMCENVECDYPFGHENVLYLKEDNEVQTNEEVVSIRGRTIKGSSVASLSMVSTSAWSEIDKMNRIYDEEQFDNRQETREYYSHRKSYSHMREKEEKQNKILKNVEEIKKLNAELISDDEKFVKPQIKNEKWIRNLMTMQNVSGILLLEPEEMKLVNAQQPEIGLGELKIDINMGSDNKMSSVKIEISNANESQT